MLEVSGLGILLADTRLSLGSFEEIPWWKYPKDFPQ